MRKTSPALLDLNWHHSDGVDEGPVLGVCLCMHEASLLPKLSLSAVHRSVFLTCVAPLQNKQRWGKTAPNSLSTPSFPQSLHENRWLWHYQQSQLVSHACSGGDRINRPLPFVQSECWKGLLFITVCLVLFCTIINIFHHSVIQKTCFWFSAGGVYLKALKYDTLKTKGICLLRNLENKKKKKKIGEKKNHVPLRMSSQMGVN